MARIIKHPEVEDYFVEMTLDDVKSRPHGIVDLYEAGRLIILKDYRLPVDFDIFAKLSGSRSRIKDRVIRSTIRTMTSRSLYRGTGPKFVEGSDGGSYAPYVTSDPVRKAVYEALCNSDPELFANAIAAIKAADEVAMALLGICFPGYKYFRAIPSVRFTTTLFEYLHWDNLRIADDFQQVRFFCNLDVRPRIWHTSHNFITYARTHYREHKLDRFAGDDPQAIEMMRYIGQEFLGGPKNACLDGLPCHVMAFEPGEVWFGETRLISHQIFYGERAMTYAFFAKPDCMLTPSLRFAVQVADLHASMGALPA
jgi:hypothetical protein